MWRKIVSSTIISSACFCLFLTQVQATGEDIWVISTGAEASFHSLLDDDYNVTTKTYTEIQTSGIPDSIELLIYPGGLSPITQVYNNIELQQAIQNYINTGGKYFGSCGGSIPGAQDLNWDYSTIDMIGLVQVNAIDRLSWASTVSYTDGFTFNNNSTINGDYINTTNWLSYTGGPAFEVVEGYEDDVEILATFAENFDPAEAPTYYQVKGKAAVVLSDYGQGKVLLSAPHPESSETTQFMFFNMIEYLLQSASEEPIPEPSAPDEEEPADESEEGEIIDEEVPSYVIAQVTNVRVPKKAKKAKKVYAKWNKIDGVSGYNIKLYEYKPLKKKYKIKRTIKIKINQANKYIKKLSPDTKYRIKVRAKVTANDIVYRGPWSESKKFRTKKLTNNN